MFHGTDDLRIADLHPLISPAILMEELPVSADASGVVSGARNAGTAILRGDDDRLLVIAGPCSIHHPAAALDYARRLHELAERLADDLLVVMRVYFEKPRTRVGWKGLINDPGLDSSFQINRGLRVARRLLVDLAEVGMPAGTEFLDTISPQFIADLVAWGAIGARTTESQVHRELASGLSMPVGFKNGTNGDVTIAIDAIGAACHPHHFLSVTKQGISAIVATKGNDACHLILRGAHDGPNHDAESVAAAARALEEHGMTPRVMVDCSHGNSRKDHVQQIATAAEVAGQVAAGSDRILGVMVESNLVAGRQDLVPGQDLTYGQSITDACMGWDDTVATLEGFARAVRTRRGSRRGESA
ncbi:MAG: 3-deoxy-7-phosphoheptulonate synthase [Planctomycetota bacterium]